MSLSGFTIPTSLSGLRNALDEVRAQVYPTSETEKKVYEALSSKNWGASTSLMGEIANETYDYDKYAIIMPIVWGNLDTEGRSWKQMFKTLTLIEFLIKNGAERIIEETRDQMYKIRPLQDYNFYENTVDKGSGVREKAKQILELLSSNDLIREERDKARSLRNKFVGISNDGGRFNPSSVADNYRSSPRNDSSGRSGRYGNDPYRSSGSDSRGTDTRSGMGSESYSPFGGGGNSRGSGSRGGERDSRPLRYAEEGTYARPPTSVPASGNTPHTSGGGKLRVQIKKTSGASSASEKPAAAAVVTAPGVDLFNTDLMNDSAPTQPTSQPTKAKDFGFDVFATPDPPKAFDPFAASGPSDFSNPYGNPPPIPAPAVPAPNPLMLPASGPSDFSGSLRISPPSVPPPPVPTSVMHKTNNSFAQMSFSPVQPILMQPIVHQQNIQPILQPPSIPAYVPTTVPSIKPVSNPASNPASSLYGGLVDLGSIGKSDKAAPSPTTAPSMSQNNSFRGLDGFQKSTASPGVGQSIGMGGTGGASMMGQQPMTSGMGMGVPMGGQSMMGGGGSMGQSMMGGYPQQQMGGAPMYGQQMGQSMMPPMGQQIYGQPMGQYGQRGHPPHPQGR